RALAGWVALTDSASAAGAVVAANLIHGPSARDSGSYWSVPIACLVGLVVFGAYRLYDFVRIAPWQEFRRLIAAVSVATVGLVLATVWRDAISRTWVGLVWVFWLLLALGSR